jgi:Fe2+ or Zn2+ uptake regulation protein
MGDKSPKDVKKQATQKQVKDTAKRHQKLQATQHAGHPPTAEELAKKKL